MSSILTADTGLQIRNASQSRIDELSNRLNRMKESPDEAKPAAESKFTDEIRKYFPGIDEGKMPSSAFKLDKMPDVSTLTGEHKRLYETAVEFQSLFINMMLKGMRSTLHPENDMLYGGKTQEIFEDFLYDERAKSFSKHGGFPLAEQIYLQMAPLVNEAADSYQDNLNQVPPTISTDQIKREWMR